MFANMNVMKIYQFAMCCALWVCLPACLLAACTNNNLLYTPAKSDAAARRAEERMDGWTTVYWTVDTSERVVIVDVVAVVEVVAVVYIWYRYYCSITLNARTIDWFVKVVSKRIVFATFTSDYEYFFAPRKMSRIHHRRHHKYTHRPSAASRIHIYMQTRVFALYSPVWFAMPLIANYAFVSDTTAECWMRLEWAWVLCQSDQYFISWRGAPLK